MSTDLHLVLVARERRQGGFDYRAVSAPLGWHAAQNLHQKLSDSRGLPRFTGERALRTHYLVRSLDDPRWAHLAPKSYKHEGRAIQAWVKREKATGYVTSLGGGWFALNGGRPIQGLWAVGQYLKRTQQLFASPLDSRAYISHWGTDPNAEEATA